MYKLIVTDMDGTLLNSIGEIPEKNLEAVKKAMAMGVEFALVTGRPYISVKRLLIDNDLKCSVIGCNGAQVTDDKGNRVKAHYIDRQVMLRIMELAESRDVYYQVYDDFYIYTKSRIKLVRMLKNYSAKSIKKHITLKRIWGGVRRLFFSEVKLKSDLIKLVKEKENSFYKIQIAALNQDVLNDIREELKKIPGIVITSSNYFNIEIGPEGVTKGTAVKELAEVKGIKREDIIAMGDNLNDIPMLEYAGCGVAMENAESEVKDKADFYTKSNDDNGVAYAIEKLIIRPVKI